jgi:branched-chain amino acid transport system substrate-binding protein
VQATRTDDGTDVADKLRTMDIDNFGETAHIRADGRVMRDLYLLQVNAPAEAKSPTDYFKYLKTIPTVEAYLPAAQSDCPLMK